MSAIPSNSGSTIRSVTTSVLKMQLDQTKQQGTAQKELIESAAATKKSQRPGGNAPGVGGLVDVKG